MKIRKKKKGFTLVELLIVIAIIGILAVVITPTAFKAIDKSKAAATISDYKAIKTATLNYYADTGAWPDQPAGDKPYADPRLVTASGIQGWNGSYLEKWPTQTPWGAATKYAYKVATSGIESVGISVDYKYIEISGLDVKKAKLMDVQLDQAESLNSGIVRYSTTDVGTTVYLVISEQ